MRGYLLDSVLIVLLVPAIFKYRSLLHVTDL